MALQSWPWQDSHSNESTYLGKQAFIIMTPLNVAVLLYIRIGWFRLLSAFIRERLQSIHSWLCSSHVISDSITPSTNTGSFLAKWGRMHPRILNSTLRCPRFGSTTSSTLWPWTMMWPYWSWQRRSRSRNTSYQPASSLKMNSFSLAKYVCTYGYLSRNLVWPSNIFDNQMCVASGWGGVHLNGTDLNPEMRYQYMELWMNEKCREHDSKFKYVQICEVKTGCNYNSTYFIQLHHWSDGLCSVSVHIGGASRSL